MSPEPSELPPSADALPVIARRSASRTDLIYIPTSRVEELEEPGRRCEACHVARGRRGHLACGTMVPLVGIPK